MLTIRQAQMRAFERAMQQSFEMRMASRLRAAFAVTQAYSEDALLDLIRQSVARAAGYGIRLESDVSRFLEYVMLYGPAFDSDPNASRAGKILRNPNKSGTRKMDELDEYDEFRR